MIKLSSGLYLKMLQNEYPDFYYDFLSLLKGNSAKDKEKMKEEIRYLIEINEPLVLSAVGNKVK